MSRADLIRTACEMIGGNIARAVDPRDGWPGIVELSLSVGIVKQYSLHISQISSMARKPYEYRFQNPTQNKPVMALPGTTPLLIGVWSRPGEQPVFVAAQAEARLGDTTRFSVLFPERLFREAQVAGWAEPFRNSVAQWHWSFFPQLLPIFAELLEADVEVPANDIQIAVVGSGLVDEDSESAGTRSRQAITRLVRRAQFGRQVTASYEGRCAMCGLNLGLVSGAHILPVSAVSSSDSITNGLCLCDNHHRAFDAHKIWVEPDSRAIRIHPAFIQHSISNPVSSRFIQATNSVLTLPREPSHIPDPQMFRERYDYFEDDYLWI